jgi:hypothetical protein
MQTNFHLLVKETISYLKEQRKTFFFAARDDLPFLQESKKAPSKKEDLPPNASFTVLPKEGKKNLPKEEVKKKTPPPTEKPLVAPLKPPLLLSKEKVPPSFESFQELQKMVSLVAPNFALINELPNDEKAKQISMSWQYKKKGATITLLCGNEEMAKVMLLKNLGRALEIRFASTNVIFAEEIEKENGWEIFLSNPEIKLILANDASFPRFPKLMSFYREIPARQERFFHHIPLLLLPDMGLYLKKSSLKALLWKTLSQQILEFLKKP